MEGRRRKEGTIKDSETCLHSPSFCENPNIGLLSYTHLCLSVSYPPVMAAMSSAPSPTTPVLQSATSRLSSFRASSPSPVPSPRTPRSLPARPITSEESAVFHYKGMNGTVSVDCVVFVCVMFDLLCANHIVVARVGQRLFSIYDGETEYEIGVVLRQNVGSQNAPHTGGYYVYRTSAEAIAATFPSTSSLFVAPRVLLRCLAWGDVRQYDNKLAFSCIRPGNLTPLCLRHFIFNTMLGIHNSCHPGVTHWLSFVHDR
jgi:hypothetical protein